MKKNFRFLALTAMAGMAATAAMAVPKGVYPAYAENFNALAKVEDAGVFTSKAASGLWSLVSPEEGNKAFRFNLGSNNSRNFYAFWGTEGWAYANSKDAGTDNFYFSMELIITAGNDAKEAQHNTEFCVFTETDNSSASLTTGNGGCNFIRKALKSDGSYDYQWQCCNDNWLFDLTEIPNKDESGTLITNAPKFAVNGDTAHVFDLTNGATYIVELTIDTVARKVEYLLTNKLDGTTALEGVRDIPAGVHQLPTGIYCNAGRGSSSFTFDNIMVGKAVDKQVPQTPSIAYSTQDAVFGTRRGFQIYCLEGETMYYEFRNGATGENLDGIQGPGTLDYSTIGALNENMVFVTNSGILVAWTQIGADKSKETSIEVVCEEVVLPTPECKIVGVKDGYAKSYQVTIDNSSVVTNPNIRFEYTFTDADGKSVTVPNNASGSIIELDKKGTLKLTSMLYGFTNSATVTIENNIEYECTKVIDFEHMTPEQMEAKGFVQQEDWVGPYSETVDGKKNRWFQIGFAMSVNVCSNGVDTAKYHIVSGQEYVDPLTVHRYQLEATSETIDSATACSLFAPLVLPSANLSSPTVTKAPAPFQIIKNMGLMINATNAGNDIPFAFRGLTDDQYALVYKISSYGRYQGTNYVAKGAYSSFEEAAADQHGILSHVIKGNGSFNLYRYDTVITRIEIMSAKAGSPISDLRVDLEDPNAPIYNLQGILMDCSKESLPKGIYLQNGKKFLVK